MRWLATILALKLAAAGPPVIGTVIGGGAFLLDNSVVSGNATLLEGTSIETRNASSSMRMSSGARVMLWPRSKGTFFTGRMVLEKGEGRLEGATAFQVAARGLTIGAAAENSSAKIVLAGGTRVQVTALAGSLHVRNPRGMLVANLAAGRALEFDPQASDVSTRLSGCLVAKAGHFVLTDETTNVVVEVAGAGLQREAGNRVELAGATDVTSAPVPEASQLVRATSLRRLAKGCASGIGAVAAAPGEGGVSHGGGGAGAGAAGGHTVVLTTAIVGGVSAASLGSLAAAGMLPGQNDVPVPLSR
jgi:hypothetical protein